jgi:hypothetical protein
MIDLDNLADRGAVSLRGMLVRAGSHIWRFGLLAASGSDRLLIQALREVRAIPIWS